jgi:hypothetical protein
MRKVLLALVLMTFSGMGIFAQTGIVTGTLRDQSDSSLLSGATIEILLQSDSSLVKPAFPIVKENLHWKACFGGLILK